MACITLLSDLGLQDASVGSAKGILMQYAGGIPLIDISHDVQPFNLRQAAYLVSSSYSNFPAGSCHILLFDVLSEKAPAMVLCEQNGHYFLAPDNGLLALAFNAEPGKIWKCYELAAGEGFKDWVRHAAIIATQLQKEAAAALGFAPCELRNAPRQNQMPLQENILEGQVIHIDRFENVVINVTRQQFEQTGNGRPFRIEFMRNEEITEISERYNNTRAGDKLCRFNSAGYLEISINRGKAASLFGLKLNQEHHLMYSTIKIFFE